MVSLQHEHKNCQASACIHERQHSNLQLGQVSFPVHAVHVYTRLAIGESTLDPTIELLAAHLHTSGTQRYC